MLLLRSSARLLRNNSNINSSTNNKNLLLASVFSQQQQQQQQQQKQRWAAINNNTSTVVVRSNSSSVKDFNPQAIATINHYSQIRKQLESDPRYQMPYNEYLALCRDKYNMDENQARELSESLHTSGVVLHFSRDSYLKDTLILKPQLLVDSLYRSCSVDLLARRRDELKAELQTVLDKIAPMVPVKEKLDLSAKRHMEVITWGSFLWLCAQTFTLAKMTWIDFGWDVVEPITYFVTFSVVLGGFTYFATTKNEYTFREVYDRMLQNRQYKLYEKHGFNIEGFNMLHEQAKKLKAQIEAHEKLIGPGINLAALAPPKSDQETHAS